MRKPGEGFNFQPHNSLASTDKPDFPKSPKKHSAKTRRELDQSYRELLHETTFGCPAASPSLPLERTNGAMPLSRSPSFGDDDLEILSSQTANMSIGQDTSKSPLRPIANPNADIVDLTNSPLGKPISNPIFGQPSQLQSQFTRRVDPNVAFIKRPANRPEHHRDLYRGSGPLKPKAGPKKTPFNQFFSSMSENAHPSSQPSSQNASQGAPQTDYRQAAAAYTDQVFYTDPTKAQADLKALLEGGMEEDEEEKDVAEEGGTIEDGTLEGIKVKLLPHQVEGVQWMQGRESGSSKSKSKGKVPKGGILADDMGLGKTLQSISLIVSNKMPKPEDKGWKKHFENIKRATLVVAPLALIRQWEAEIKDKVSKSHGLKVYVHHGPQRTKDPSQLARYDVVITTYQILVSEHGSSSPDPKGLQAGCFGVHWFRVILDEAHSIKNRNAKATKAACALRSEYRWCLTGTPMQNNLDELQSLVHFLRIEPYDNLSHWREQIDLPMKNGRGHIAIRRLHTLLRCFMKRRTKDILKEEGALVAGGKKALDAAAAKAEKEGTAVEAPKPAFKITERKVVTVATEFSPAERKFYDQLEERADKSLEKMIQGKSVNYANALVLLLRLRQACNHPRLAENKLDKDQEALSTDTAAQPKSGGDADIDALADALGGMNIQTKRCDMCMSDLSRQEVADGYARCAACTKSLDELNGESPAQKKPKKKSRRVSVVTEEIKIEKKRSARNRGRKILADSDDEDEEADGSWLVPEGQQGSLRLGKAGGEEDENAEGGGEDLDSEDSDRSEEDEDGSQLDSFIVKDESHVADGQEKAGSDDGDSSSSEDETFVSVSRIQSQVQRLQQQSQQGASELGSDESESEEDNSGISESELNSDSDSDASPRRPSQRRKKGSKGDPSHVMTSAKIRELIKIVRKEVEEHKFIVFSQFTSMLDLIEPFFRAQSGFKAVRYDGKMPNDQREAALHALRTDPHTRILLCSLKCGSLGLNLTAATRVVIVEPFWNPFVEEQAIDRVHRLTQTIDVVIYKLTVAGTVEERIVELQNKKRLLAEAAIEGGMRKKGKDALKLGLAEIMELFKHDGRAPQDTGYSRDPEDNSVVRQDIGEMVRGMTGIVRRKEGRQEHEVYGRRW